MELRPDDQGAMFYMSLMYLEKAAVECDDLTAREEDQKTVGAWVNKIEFGVPVKARKSPFRDLDRQLGAACGGTGSGEFTGTGEPYDVAEAYEVYSAIIPIINPNPETHTWFIRYRHLADGSGFVATCGSVGAGTRRKGRGTGTETRGHSFGRLLEGDCKTLAAAKKFHSPKTVQTGYSRRNKDNFPASFPGREFWGTLD
jgi:hypothetical protein